MKTCGDIHQGQLNLKVNTCSLYHVDLHKNYNKSSEDDPLMSSNLLFGPHSKLNRKVRVTVHIIVNIKAFFNDLFLFLYLKSTVVLCSSNNTYQEALGSLLALAMVYRFLHA